MVKLAGVNFLITPITIEGVSPERVLSGYITCTHLAAHPCTHTYTVLPVAHVHAYAREKVLTGTYSRGIAGWVICRMLTHASTHFHNHLHTHTHTHTRAHTRTHTRTHTRAHTHTHTRAHTHTLTHTRTHTHVRNITLSRGIFGFHAVLPQFATSTAGRVSRSAAGVCVRMCVCVCVCMCTCVCALACGHVCYFGAHIAACLCILHVCMCAWSLNVAKQAGEGAA